MRSLDSLKEGHLVTVYCEETTSIGEVRSLAEDKIEIAWLKGSYTTAWTTWVLYEGRTKVEWRDSIPKTSVILYDFELTKTKHLRKATITHLKRAYEQLRLKAHESITFLLCSNYLLYLIASMYCQSMSFIFNQGLFTGVTSILEMLPNVVIIANLDNHACIY